MTQAAAATLDDYRWRDRILLVFAPGIGRALNTQRAVVRDNAAAFAERDLRVVEVVGDSVAGTSDAAAALRRRFDAGASFRVVLLGKDGGVKLAAAAPITADRLFATIDAMPMRADEMRRR